MSIHHQHRRVSGTYFEWLPNFKGESRLPFFLPPGVVHLRVAHDDPAVVLVEAGVKVEGDIVPPLEIQSESV